jgi:hypothetical protein
MLCRIAHNPMEHLSIKAKLGDFAFDPWKEVSNSEQLLFGA